jgi:hypothetical protein
MVKVIAWFRKTRAFLSFQIFHETNIAREAMAFLDSSLLWIT